MLVFWSMGGRNIRKHNLQRRLALRGIFAVPRRGDSITMGAKTLLNILVAVCD